MAIWILDTDRDVVADIQIHSAKAEELFYPRTDSFPSATLSTTSFPSFVGSKELQGQSPETLQFIRQTGVEFLCLNKLGYLPRL